MYLKLRQAKKKPNKQTKPKTYFPSRKRTWEQQHSTGLGGSLGHSSVFESLLLGTRVAQGVKLNRFHPGQQENYIVDHVTADFSLLPASACWNLKSHLIFWKH